MGKLKVGDIEAKIDSWKISITDDAGGYVIKSGPVYRSAEITWGDYRISEIDYTEKDKTEMKITGTIVNNKIVLDEPVEYVGVFEIFEISKTLGARNGNRYEFEVKSMGSSKPEIVNASKITNERNVNRTIQLSGSLIENYSNRSHAEQIVVKAIAQNIVESSIEAFKIAKTEYLDKALEAGYCAVYSGDDVFEKLLQLNSTEFHGEKVAFFYVTIDENESKNQSDNHIESYFCRKFLSAI
jgi:hypothetical protein